MTFVHFMNCLALAYAPYVVVYKSSILSEYNALLKLAYAGFIYMVTQLVKMLALATFFPSIDESTSSSVSVVAELLKTTVDVADLVGLYYIISTTVGKPELKVLIAGVGWAGSQVLFSYVLSFWVGARGLEFSWKYIQMALDANITLVHVSSLAVLVWIWTRNDLNRSFVPMISTLLGLAVFRTVIVEIIVQALNLSAWISLLAKALYTLAIACVSLQLYVGFVQAF